MRQFICKEHRNNRHNILGPDINDIPENDCNLSNNENLSSSLICEDTLHSGHLRNDVESTPSSPDRTTTAHTKNSPRRKSPNEIRNFSTVSLKLN